MKNLLEQLHINESVPNDTNQFIFTMKLMHGNCMIWKKTRPR